MFLEKYSKLRSNVTNQGDENHINIFDDEIDSEKPFMWLKVSLIPIEHALEDQVNEGRITTETEQYLLDKYSGDDVVYVSIIDIDDSLYFNLHANKRQIAATLLMKRFIKYYKENFESKLVYAEFMNLELKDSFVSAVEKGIFPKDSLLFIRQITEEIYYINEKYNMQLREEKMNINQQFLEVVRSHGFNNIELFSSAAYGVKIRDTPISFVDSNGEQVINDFNDVIDLNLMDLEKQLESLKSEVHEMKEEKRRQKKEKQIKTVEAKIRQHKQLKRYIAVTDKIVANIDSSGDIFITLPMNNSSLINSYRSMTYDRSTKTLYLEFRRIDLFIKPVIDKFRTIFDEVQYIKHPDFNDVMTLEEYLDDYLSTDIEEMHKRTYQRPRYPS